MRRGLLQIATVFAMVALAGLWLGSTVASADEPSGQGMTEQQWQLFKQFVVDRQMGIAQPGTGRRNGSLGASSAGSTIGASAVVSVTGRVVDPSGNGIADAEVYANRVTTFTPTGTTCPAGSGTGTPTPIPTPTMTATPFGTPPPSGEVPNLVFTTAGPDGSFDLTLSTGDWFLGTTKAGLLSGGGSSQRLPVQSSNITTVTLTLLPPTNTINGVLRYSNGTPVTSTFPLAVSGFGSRTSPDGTLEFFNASGKIVTSTGVYSIGVVTGTWEIFSPFVFGTSEVRTGVSNISVTAGVNPNVDIMLREANAPISGRVVNDLGTPIAGASINANLVVSAGQPSVTTAFSGTVAGSDGTFSLPLFAGLWDLIVVSRTTALQYATPGDLRITAPSSGQVITLLREVNCIQGRVTDPNGNPASTAFIQGRYQPPGQSYSYSTFSSPDAAGNYALPVGPGTWEVRAGANMTFTHSVTRTVTVPPDQTGVDLQLQALTSPTATGTVPSGTTATPSATASPSATTPSGGNTATPSATQTGATATPSATRVVGSPTPTYSATPEGTPSQRVFLPLITKSVQGW